MRGKSIAVLGSRSIPTTCWMRLDPIDHCLTGYGRQDPCVRSRHVASQEDSRERHLLQGCLRLRERHTHSGHRDGVGAVSLPRLKELASITASSVIVDLRNIYSPEEVMRNGFHYCGVGTPNRLLIGSRCSPAIHVPANRTSDSAILVAGALLDEPARRDLKRGLGTARRRQHASVVSTRARNVYLVKQITFRSRLPPAGRPS